MSQDASYGIWHKMDASVERFAVQRRARRTGGSLMLLRFPCGGIVRCNGLLDGSQRAGGTSTSFWAFRYAVTANLSSTPHIGPRQLQRHRRIARRRHDRAGALRHDRLHPILDRPYDLPLSRSGGSPSIAAFHYTFTLEATYFEPARKCLQRAAGA